MQSATLVHTSERRDDHAAFLWTTSFALRVYRMRRPRANGNGCHHATQEPNIACDWKSQLDQRLAFRS